ncbi:MAG: Mrp/NBP35 family ATP-binding protein [Ignisphaera sp.]
MMRADLRNLKDVRNIVAVMSGKGGVGKSFVSAALAIAFRELGYSVAILDADIHGPSIPWMLGVESGSMGASIDGSIVPLDVDGIAVASFELLLPSRESPIVWRGPLKTRAILELVSKTSWGYRDFMVVDMPPGTGDEHLTIAQFLKPFVKGAVLVLTPGDLVLHVVRKAREFLKGVGIDLLGAIVNMAYFRCPVCGTIHKIFGEYSAEDIQILAEIPIKPELAQAINRGEIIKYLKSFDRELLETFIEVAKKIASKVAPSTT